MRCRSGQHGRADDYEAAASLLRESLHDSALHNVGDPILTPTEMIADAVCRTPSLRSHQPRHAIWDMLDSVLILAKGYQLFFGSPEVRGRSLFESGHGNWRGLMKFAPLQAADKWFANLFTTRPPHVSTADFIMDRVNIDFFASELHAADKKVGDRCG
jgi:hypothetical protein